MSMIQVDDDKWVNPDHVIRIVPSKTSYAKAELDLRDSDIIYSSWTPDRVAGQFGAV